MFTRPGSHVTLRRPRFDGREDILGGGSSGLQSPAGYSREGDAEDGAPRKREMKGI